MEDILIAKKKRDRQNQIKIRVKNKLDGRPSGNSYKKVLNVRDSSDIAILFSDLDTLFDAPIEKAYKKYKKGKSPFW